MSAATVFFSWQSDKPTREGRSFVEKALATAIRRISQDIQVDEPLRGALQVDKDTQGVPGSPPIFETILRKIDRAAVFVPDLTFVSHRPNGDPTPNPNVLIEYGYALKSLTHNRIVAVMNTAFGKPSRESMPFDLAHHRFPITYHLPDGTADETRKDEQERLARTLETAIKAVLGSDAYKSSLPEPPPLPAVRYREPLQGRARFRSRGEPIGFANDPLQMMLGNQDWQVMLAGGAAVWLRVMPQQPIEKPLKIGGLQKVVPVLMAVPLYNAYSNTLQVRGGDGVGLCTPLGPEPSPSVVFVFTDAEIWTIDTYALRALPKFISLDESKLAESLQRCAAFLHDQLNVAAPYRWVAGVEGMKGRSLPVPNNPYGARGPCVSDLIEEEGIFNLGDQPSAVLEPFFEEVFEQCGVLRKR